MSNLEAGPGSFPVKRAAIPDHPENEQFAPAARMIAAAGQQAVTEKEALTTEMLRQIYRLMLQDNNLTRAYGKLIEIDKAQDEPEESMAKKRKGSAVSQFTDVEAAIEKQEKSCYRQLEQSLAGHSSDEARACSEWIRRAKLPGHD